MELIGWLGSKGVVSRTPLHTLRKDFGSQINARFGLVAAQRMLHHAQVAVTAAHYVEIKAHPSSWALDILLTKEGADHCPDRYGERRKLGASDLPFGRALESAVGLRLLPMKSISHPAIREALQKTPEGRSLLREEQMAKVRACQDIVHDWDDPDDFSLWREVFASSLSSSGDESSPSSARP